MTPIILDANFNRIAELDDFISFIWTTRYYSAGDFELCADISRVGALPIGYYVTRKEDDTHVGIIESVSVQRTEEARDMVIASGRFLPAFLARRIIPGQTQLSGLVTDGIETLINDNAISPENTDRAIDGMTFTCEATTTEEMEVQYTGVNLLETIEAICETYGIGLDCTLGENNSFDVRIYEGVDRSYNQTENPYIVFSDLNDNLLTSSYGENRTTYVTDVLVGGEGTGTSQTLVWSAKDSQTGLDRYEEYLDASNAVTNDHIVTQQVYEQQLNELGLQEIAQNTFTEAFQGEVDFANVKLGVDVNVGDICTIENSRWGVYINSRLVEVIESIDEEGAYSATPTFGA